MSVAMNGMTLDNGCSNEGATDDVSNMCNEDVLDKVGVSEEKGPDPLLRSDVGDEEDDEDEEDEEDEEISESEGITLILFKPLPTLYLNYSFMQRTIPHKRQKGLHRCQRTKVMKVIRVSKNAIIHNDVSQVSTMYMFLYVIM